MACPLPLILLCAATAAWTAVGRNTSTTSAVGPLAAGKELVMSNATNECSVVGGGTINLPECYSACSNLGCYRTWTLVQAGERRFFGQFSPHPGGGAPMP
eukprot:COSAG05_NODE_18367_length_309_cov_0.990476_1_plen_99_part_01